MSERKQGILLQGIGGFYYVETADAVYECRAKGAFRREHQVPIAGDRVTVLLREGQSPTLEEILPRKNSLIRPPVANVDQLAIVSSVAEPAVGTLLLDKLIAMAEAASIEPLIVFTKTDLATAEPWESVYRSAGFSVFTVSTDVPESIRPFRERLTDAVTVLAGNSGVGKSSLLNLIDPTLQLKTGEISQKLGRGRHTTRAACLFSLESGGYVADTAGFSSLDTDRVLSVSAEDLRFCFREFEPYEGQCRFVGCAHDREPDCAVKSAVESGAIAASRYESYRALYAVAKAKKEWET